MIKLSIIQVDHLTIRSDKQTIIEDLSFAIEAGEWVAFEGPSGSGKSTVLKFLSQLLDPSLSVQGDYRLDDQSILDYDPIQIRQTVSYCFQSPNLFGQTVADNLRFPYELRDQTFDSNRAVELLHEVGLDEEFLTKEINTLSGGEKQRVALIRNLMFPPKVLLLDEITSALDNHTRQLVWRWLQQVKDEYDLTILMVSHDEEDRAIADRQIEIPKLTRQTRGEDQ